MEMDPKQAAPKPAETAKSQVSEAHGLLTKMREQLEHPDLDRAIEKLEMALSILTTNTGGML